MIARSTIARLASLFVILPACGGKVVVDASSGAGGSGGGGAVVVSSSGTGTLGDCGAGMLPCQADEYCDFPDDACGSGAGIGVCTKRPPFCDDGGTPDPVCGCNGKIYAYACDAALAGQDRGPNTLCPVGGTYFVCGPVLVCDGTQSYCQHSVSDVGGEPDGWGCKPFPQCGGQNGCLCVEKEPCGDLCSADANTNVTVTCPGG